MENPYMRHLETLIRHGAQVVDGDGMKPLSTSFVVKAREECRRIHTHAILYDLILPDIDELLAIAIWADGRIDSGSAGSVLKVTGVG